MNQFHLTSGEQSNFIDSVKNESKTYVGVNICDPIERRQEYSQQQQKLIFSWFLYRCGLIASFWRLKNLVASPQMLIDPLSL